MTDPAAPATAEAIYAEHRKCGPKYEGCYSHFTFMDHCRADGMAWPCDVAQLAASRPTPPEALDVERLHEAADHMNVAHQRWVWDKVAAEYARLSPRTEEPDHD